MFDLDIIDKIDKYEVNNLEECLLLCAKLREKDNLPHRIFIKESSYLKSFEFPYSNFFIEGAIEISNSLYGNKLDDDGVKLTTWRTATLKIKGNNNIFKGLKIVNDAKDSPIKGQEVALAVYGNNNIFIDLRIESSQDTLFIGPLPDDLCTRYINFLKEDEIGIEGNLHNYFVNCSIKGTVDFVFGAGQASFHRCRFISLEDNRTSYVFAPAHSLKDDFGFFINESSFISEGVKPSSTYLARPWRDYGKVVINNSTYSAHIKEKGFSSWENTTRYLTSRFYEIPLRKARSSFVKTYVSLPYIYEEEISILKLIEEKVN